MGGHRRFGLVARHGGEHAADHNDFTFEGVPQGRFHLDFGLDACGHKPSHNLLECRVCKLRHHALRDDGPMPSNATTSSTLAWASYSREPKLWANSLATVSPTWRMPSANNTRSNGTALLAARLVSRLSTDFWAMRSSGSN